MNGHSVTGIQALVKKPAGQAIGRQVQFVVGERPVPVDQGRFVGKTFGSRPQQQACSAAFNFGWEGHSGYIFAQGGEVFQRGLATPHLSCS